MILRRFILSAVFVVVLAAPALAQVSPSAYSDSAPDQITGFYIRSQPNYFLKTGTRLESDSLNGFGAEYAYRRFYPFEILGSVSYSKGHLFSQRFVTAVAGVGYTRNIERFMVGGERDRSSGWYQMWSPYVSVQCGIARTSSNDEMYLYTKPKMGFVSVFSAGVDYQLRRHLAIRPIFFDDEYLPFAVRGMNATYWQFGAGVGYTFHWR